MVRVGSGYEASLGLASQPYFSEYAHARAKVGGGSREGKYLGARAPGHTYQVFVAPAQDLEPTNQIAATRKLHVN